MGLRLQDFKRGDREDIEMKILLAGALFAVLLLSGCINQRNCRNRYEFYNNGTVVTCNRAEWMYGSIAQISLCNDGQSYANPVNVKIIETCD